MDFGGKMEIKKIGIIGLGMLGNSVALHLIDSGFEVTVYNRTKEKGIHLKGKGAKISSSPKEFSYRTAKSSIVKIWFCGPACSIFIAPHNVPI